MSFQREYWHEVFTPFLKAYQDGGTPNPDLSCNRHIKFGHFAEHARQLGADRVATGHYARLRTEGDGRVQLLAALDQTKDQSYFLAAVRQEGLARTLFPLGALRKDRVRELAAEAGLHVAAKRDSVGICFVGKRDFGDFIGGYLPQAPGDFVCVETGAVLGRHRGVTQYTPGQRARLGGSPSKRYVVSKDVGTGTIVLCEGGGHPALRRRTLRAGPPLWVAGVAPEALLRGGELRCAARVRYQQPLAHCTVRSSEASSPMLDVTFDEPLRHVAEQQALVLYDGEVCFGAATIVSRGPSAYAEQQHQEQLQKHAEQQVARWRSSHSGAGAV